MTYEEWWNKEVATKDSWVEDLCREAWEAGIQEGIDRIGDLYDICPECRETAGRHQMDCGRG